MHGDVGHVRAGRSAPDHIDIYRPARIEQAMPDGAAAGDRYPEAQMGHLDSERG